MKLFESAGHLLFTNTILVCIHTYIYSLYRQICMMCFVYACHRGKGPATEDAGLYKGINDEMTESDLI